MATYTADLGRLQEIVDAYYQRYVDSASSNSTKRDLAKEEYQLMSSFLASASEAAAANSQIVLDKYVSKINEYALLIFEEPSPALTITEVTGGGGIPDAPSDGSYYGRRDNQWEQVSQTGPTGPQGPAGADGSAGANGADGADGDSAYQIWLAQGNIGTPQDFLDSLEGISAYQVWLDQGNAGTELDFLASLTGADGSDGATGPTGATGPSGADGTDGLSAYEVWLAQGNAGTAQDFLDSLEGLSAYEVWLAQGNAGTELDFLASLVGATGPAGADGADGADGATGATGPAGADGADGTSIQMIVLGKTSNQNVGGANGTEVYWTWNVQNLIDGTFSHTSGNSQITIEEDGWYEITFVGAAQQAGSARTTLQGIYRVNGGSTLRGGSLRNYSRGSVYGNITTGLLYTTALSAGDVIEVGTRVEDTDGVYTLSTNAAEINNEEHQLVIRKVR